MNAVEICHLLVCETEQPIGIAARYDWGEEYVRSSNMRFNALSASASRADVLHVQEDSSPVSADEDIFGACWLSRYRCGTSR
jgi:hypothetical protein